MRTSQNENLFDPKHRVNDSPEMGSAFSKIMICAIGLALFSESRIDRQSNQSWRPPDIPWAFPVRDKVQPVLDNRSGPIQIPGSTKTYTQEQIDDIKNPPDWFPEEHPPMPRVVAHGADGGVLGCASCHLGSGLGHPESANLAGMSAGYIERQLSDFKNGLRMGQAMNDISKDLTDEDAKESAEWFSKLTPKIWESVVETERVPKTFVNMRLMRMPLSEAGDEPIGMRIIELPQDIARAESRDPHSGFIAYVPLGSLARGKELLTAGGGKTMQCTICHGASLNGMGEVPAIAGHSPIYLFRQLYYFKDGSRRGSMSGHMMGVVRDLAQDDILAIAAYVGSLTPGKEDNHEPAALPKYLSSLEAAAVNKALRMELGK